MSCDLIGTSGCAFPMPLGLQRLFDIAYTGRSDAYHDSDF